jgi:hypothetical protein
MVEKICLITNLHTVRTCIKHFGLTSAVKRVAYVLVLCCRVKEVIKTDNPNLFNDTHYTVAVANAFP